MSTPTTDVLGTVENAPPAPPPAAPAADEGLKRLESKIAEQSGQISALSRALQSRPVATPPPAQPAAPQNPENLRREFYEKPLEMSAAIAYRAANDVAAQQAGATIETLKALARDRVRQSDPDLFDKFSHEIDALVAQNTAPQFHGNIQVWQAAANMVYGAHRHEIAPRPEGNRAPAVRTGGDGPAAPNVRQAPAPPARQTLSDDEKRIARGMGMSEEKYLHGKGLVSRTNDMRVDSAPNAFDSVEGRPPKRNVAGAK